ncbi:unnamed protein product [Rotaria magnacalcarata]|uniref:Peptidase S1 domain-containing protein n=1 Tax=Rotaria magnacalcarata TaxID=392030 RepID=A0A816XJZ7_9BILA|nr:unnamed protein product [Rotaria magnacalcarata]CAF1572701.1 unnamed protein product [Rotaria magnacalcarata]CAF2112986.1 unnamed protein product [Rotaria magnacalcarata]CAF2147848.1 unnamed protein product [Rotaria magnacalcarata]CAF2261116.1 unnamed protein product [Rotaria magnacalcarata]
MNTVSNSSQVIHDANNSREIIIDDPLLFDNNSNKLPPIGKVSTTTIRNFRRSLYGLPFTTTPRTSSTSSTSLSPSLLFYHLYSLNVLQHQSNGTIRSSTKTCRTTATSIRTNVSLSVQPALTSKSSIDTKQKQTCFYQYRYRCICVLSIILILFLLIILPLIFTSNFFIRLSSCDCPVGYERNLSTSSSCTCIDRNECLNSAGFHICTGLNMQCINTMGSYICRCRPGFVREIHQDSCVDINECNLYTPCNTSISNCINLPGRYYCQCLISQTNNEQCVPKNICAEQNDLCGPYSECVVSSSTGYNCECLPGHIMHENGQCSKINECEMTPSLCERGRSCILTRDRFDCCTSNKTKNDTGECAECGLPINRRLARIVNGDRSYRGQWPWMAVVGVYFRDDTNRWINITQKCAATLIANRYLLTAAHCLSNQLPTFDTMRLPNRYQSSLKDTYRVSFDAIDIENDIVNSRNTNKNESNEKQQSRTFTLEHACIHPGFNHNTLLHDIAILKLKQPIVRSSLVDTICLATDEQSIDNGTKVWVAGWGSNAEYSSSLNVLMHADLQMLPPSLCPSIESHDYQLCAGWSDGKKDACRGDSGGPLMLYSNNRWHIIGIVSFGDGCSRANSGGVYTRVSAYHKWILDIMSSSTIPSSCSSFYDYTQIVTDISTVN